MNGIESLKKLRQRQQEQKQSSARLRFLLLSVLIAGFLIVLLSGCETLRLPAGEPPRPEPTLTMLRTCPEELPFIKIEQQDWNNLTPDQQVTMLISLQTNWAIIYFRCQSSHNSLVEYYYALRP